MSLDLWNNIELCIRIWYMTHDEYNVISHLTPFDGQQSTDDYGNMQ